MIVFEVEKEKLNYQLIPGLYQLGEELTTGLLLCEKDGMYEGTVELKNLSFRGSYIYTNNYYSKKRNGYIKYKLPNILFNKYWLLSGNSEKEKYEWLNKIIKCFSIEKNDIENIFEINRIVLFYGPHGSGKSILIRALANKFAIRSSKTIIMKEIICSKLFSHFSYDTLKILNYIFKKAKKDTIFIIDDIEILMRKRENDLNKRNMDEIIMLVNAFLQILDRKDFNFIFTTKNLKDLDYGFLDRCDYIIEVGCGNEEIAYNELYHYIKRLKKLDYVEYDELLTYNEIIQPNNELNKKNEYSEKLLEASKLCKEFSIRQIQKVIVQSFNFRKITMDKLLDNLLHNIKNKICLMNLIKL